MHRFPVRRFRDVEVNRLGQKRHERSKHLAELDEHGTERRQRLYPIFAVNFYAIA